MPKQKTGAPIILMACIGLPTLLILILVTLIMFTRIQFITNLSEVSADHTGAKSQRPVEPSAPKAPAKGGSVADHGSTSDREAKQ
jgi:hypothetical protein